MSIAFLEENLIAEMTIKTGEFFHYTPETQNQLEYMVLDAQALQHLEVVESASGKIEGSIFHYLDNCKSAFGKRQLKRWLLSPLMNIDKLNDRLDAVEDLMQNQYDTDVFRSRIAKIPDLEKLVAKLYTYSIKHKVKAIYFENVSLNKMREFRQVLKTLKSLDEVVEHLRNRMGEFKSKRLRQLLTDEDEKTKEGLNGLYPINIKQLVNDFENMVVWKKAQGVDEEIPEPQPGLDERFD